MLKNSNRNVLSVGPGFCLIETIMFLMMQILKKKREIRTRSKMLAFLGENQQKKMNAEKSFSLKSQCHQDLTV
jgi:hypothetical protein